MTPFAQPELGVTPMALERQKQDKRYRWQVRFWVDLEKSDERWLAEYIAYLKKRRGFMQAVRDGLWLIHDLQQGKTDALRELFPHIGDLFASEWRVNEERLADLIAARVGQNTAPIRLLSVSESDEPEVKITEAEAGNEVQNLLNSIRGVTGKPEPKGMKSIAGAGNIAPPEFED